MLNTVKPSHHQPALPDRPLWCGYATSTRPSASYLSNHGSDPAHTYAKFSTGNTRTLKEAPEELGLDTRAALLEFHSTYYSANIMGLTILGRVRDF